MAINPLAGTSSGAMATVAEKDKLGQAQFMQLMIAQLRNQDPTKPMDPSEFLGQLAQFGTVSGIQDMQNSLSTLSDALRSSQVLGGTNLVGHDVLAAADTASLGATGDVQGAVTIPEGTNAAMLVVTDASGQLIRKMPLSSQQGDTAFTWDGTTDLGTRAPAGNYTISALASVGGADEQLETQLSSRVGSVTIDPATNSLTLNTSLGPIPLSHVRRVM
ncbi:MAG: flagellar hook capping FlgD N-terminal domain-containing protein [Steroidobacteraceae bacterium]